MSAFRLRLVPFAPYQLVHLLERRPAADGASWHLVACCPDLAAARAMIPPGTVCIEPHAPDGIGAAWG